MKVNEQLVALAVVSFYVLAYSLSPSTPAPKWFVRHIAAVRVMVLLAVASVPLACVSGGPWGMLVATVVTLAYADFLALSVDDPDLSSPATLP